ncbi:MAG TPA: ATP-binding protein, partial [Phaeodactylibacter sp.]|nr:ATP-binding protein [Phaeodactylibacter sp.]
LYMYTQKGEENVEPQLRRAIDYFQQMGDDYRVGWCYEDLGQLYRKRGLYQAAEDALTKAARYFRQSQNPMREGRVLQSLYQWSRAEGNAEAALSYLESYRHIEDSLRRVDVENNLNALRVEAETEKKEQALQIKELELAQKTQERNLLLFSILLLALLAALVFWGLRQRLRANRQLAAQQQQIQQQRIQQLEQEAKLSSLQSMIEGQERERLRVANDLHDSLGGVITAAQNHFANLLARTPRKTQNGLERRTGELLEHAGQELRRISQNLMPRSLTLLGLEGALEDLAGQLREQGINGQFQSIGLTQRLSEEQAVPLFRIAQELVNNVLKHAQGSQVLIQLLQRDGQLFLTVEDNGRGFDLEKAKQQASLGMSSVGSRVAYLKGELDIDTAIGQGTSVTVTIPL